MFKVAFIAGTYQPKNCGVAHYTAHLRETLIQRGIQSTVLTSKNAAQVTDDKTVLGVVNEWHIKSLFALIQAVHRTRADLLHIQHAAGTYEFNRAIFLLPLLLRWSGWQKPIVTTAHEYGWWEWQPKGVPPHFVESLKTWGQKRGWWDREDGFLLTQSDAIITTNSEAETAIDERLPDLKSRVHRIPIAANVTVDSVDRSQARQQILCHCNWSKNVEIVTFFSFLHPVKGLETLLPAFKRVIVDRPQARLLLMGGVESLALPQEQADRYWKQLRSRIHELELNNFVYMTGYLEAAAVSQYLSASDVGVLPFNPGVTLKSGSLLAMMAHSLPVIATRATPPDPDLEDERLMISIPPRQIESLATAILSLLANPSLRQQLGTAAHQFSCQFTWGNITNSHLEIYRDVLKIYSNTDVTTYVKQPIKDDI